MNTTSCLFAEKLLQLSQFLEGSDICAQRQCSKRITICNSCTLRVTSPFQPARLTASYVTPLGKRSCSGTPQFHLPQNPVSVVLWAKEIVLGDCWELSRTKMLTGFRNLSFVDPFSHSDYSLHRHTETFKQVERFSLKISRAKTCRQYNFCIDMMAYFTKNQESTKIYFFHKQKFSSSPR